MTMGRAAAPAASAIIPAAAAAAARPARLRSRQYSPPPAAMHSGMNILSFPCPATLPIRKSTHAHTRQKTISNGINSRFRPKRSLI